MQLEKIVYKGVYSKKLACQEMNVASEHADTFLFKFRVRLDLMTVGYIWPELSPPGSFSILQPDAMATQEITALYT